jgi:hypothetical protein
VRTTEVEEKLDEEEAKVKEETLIYDLEALTLAIKAMKVEDKDAFFKKVLIEEDF